MSEKLEHGSELPNGPTIAINIYMSKVDFLHSFPINFLCTAHGQYNKDDSFSITSTVVNNDVVSHTFN